MGADRTLGGTRLQANAGITSRRSHARLAVVPCNRSSRTGLLADREVRWMPACAGIASVEPDARPGVRIARQTIGEGVKHVTRKPPA
jgi:hypothetical protein